VTAHAALLWWGASTTNLLIALMMEAARTSETLLNFYQTTLRYNPEDSYQIVIGNYQILVHFNVSDASIIDSLINDVTAKSFCHFNDT
jgi:hypothetical protein